MVADGEVVERALPGDIAYSKWSAGMVLKEMQKAGWRLADLLEKTVGAAITATPPPGSPTPVVLQGEDKAQPSPIALAATPNESVTAPPRWQTPP